MIKHILGIAAGKGGVGKSTVAVNLARTLKLRGWKVGILDADLYGPSIPHMMPEDRLPEQSSENPEKILPALSQGIKTISMTYFRKQREALIVRAPIANATIQQFLHSVEWGELDVLLIDFPPGTGDIQLSLAQQAKLTAAIIVTLPQAISLIDVRKAAQLFEYTKVPILGVVENMHGLFPGNSGVELSQETGAPLLVRLPYDPLVCSSGDSGKGLEEGHALKAFEELADSVERELSGFSDVVDDLEVSLKDPRTLFLQWIDGLTQEIDVAELQQNCPCMRCRHSCLENDPLVQVESIAKMGRYALGFKFSSGCSRGIYPLKMLRGWKQKV